MPEFMDMQITTWHTSAAAVWADALFVSVLQRSDKPDASQVRQAVAATVRVYGGRGCAQRVAQEFGDHPETAVARMHWARAVVGTMPGSPPRPAHRNPATSRERVRQELLQQQYKEQPYQSEHDQLIALYTEGR